MMLWMTGSTTGELSARENPDRFWRDRMFRTIARLAAGLLLLLVAACGIESNDDLSTKLKPLTPLQAGTYADVDGKDKPMTLTRQGNFYDMETRDNDKVHHLRLSFYQIPEFDGYIAQFTALELSPGDTSKKNIYLFARVIQEHLVLYDENIEQAVLPPQVASLFEKNGQAKTDEAASNTAEDDKTIATHGRSDKLRDGESVLFVLRVLAVARYPLKEMMSLKRIQ
jgi:hypothetical protein